MSLLAAAFVVFTAVSRAWRQWRESTDEHLKRKCQLQGQLEGAHTYEGWALAATKLEQLEGRSPSASLDRWKRETRLYDRKLLEERLQHLRVVRQQGDVHEMHVAVRADLLRNLGNMTNRWASSSASTAQQPAPMSRTSQPVVFVNTKQGLLPAQHYVCKAAASPVQDTHFIA